MRRAPQMLLVLTAVVAMMGSALPAAAASAALDRVPVVEIGDGAAVTGSSTLRRTPDGIRAVIQTRGLVAGDAYTVWAVVFNNPEACEGNCDAADLTVPEVSGYSLFGAGGVASAASGVFTVRIRRGEQLIDPQHAEIHFVVRTHGPALPGLVGEQTTTLNGGCPPNACSNVLMAKHG